ncbi:MAG: HIRAN domain-containing protein [Bacteroidales bacterium]
MKNYADYYMKYSRSIGNIFLVWRQSIGKRRNIVGVIRRNSTDGIRFKYTISEKEAKEIGFTPYVDFPNLDNLYTTNVLEVFSLRLTKPERPDIDSYYEFWEIEPKFQQDKFYLLAHTQGLLATDNFEFIADYNPQKGLSFVSEICGLSHTNPPADVIEVGDKLHWEKEPTNQYDQNAVKLFKDDIFLGYVKTKHCNIFSKTQRLNVYVKHIDRNGRLHRVFIKISVH